MTNVPTLRTNRWLLSLAGFALGLLMAAGLFVLLELGARGGLLAVSAQGPVGVARPAGLLPIGSLPWPTPTPARPVGPAGVRSAGLGTLEYPPPPVEPPKPR